MPAHASPLARRRVRTAWGFLAPLLLVLALVAGWPLLRTVALSFTDARLGTGAETRFVGWRNYLFYGPNVEDWDDALGGYYVFYEPTGASLVYKPGEDRFYDLATGALHAGTVDRDLVFEWQGLLLDRGWWRSVGNTLVFAGVSVAIETVLGLVIALTLNAHLPGRGLLRAAVLIPWAIPTVVSAQMWNWMYNDFYGVINAVLLALGLIDVPQAWTADPSLAMGAVIAVDVWKTTPFMALLILAALQMLPQECYEAGRIDGVPRLTMFFRVTLPLIRPALMVAVIFRSLDALRIFDVIYVLTGTAPQTASMSIYARQQLVDFQNVGYGSAAATLLFLIVALVTVIWITLGRVGLAAER